MLEKDTAAQNMLEVRLVKMHIKKRLKLIHIQFLEFMRKNDSK